MGRIPSGSRKKKLKEAARHWLKGGSGNFDTDDAAMLGDKADACVVPTFLVHPDNWQAVVIFTAASTQWRWYEQHRMGLRYSEVKVLMDVEGVQDMKDCMDRIRIMEQEVLDVSSTM